MTKQVRIENADTAPYGVVVEVWDKGYPEGQPDVLAKTVELNHPTAMTDSGVYLTSTRYLVVKEKPVTVPAPTPHPAVAAMTPVDTSAG